MLHLQLALVLLVTACAGGSMPSDPGPAGGYRVLFIGNSLTAANDLPGTVAQLAALVNDTLVVESVTRPNYAVIDHVNGMSNAVDVIRRGHWDYVVLHRDPPASRSAGTPSFWPAACCRPISWRPAR